MLQRIWRPSTQIRAVLAILHLVLPPFATAQNYITSGTIVVVAQTKDRIIIAADSRTGSTSDGIIIKDTNDQACKIAAFDGDVAFSAAGVLGHRIHQWTALSVAVDLFKSSIHRPVGSIHGEAILEMWADTMKRRLTDFLPHQLLSVATANEGRITIGILAGLENKRPWLRAVMINYSAPAGLSHRSYMLTSKDPPTAYYFFGKSQIALEFEQEKVSPRAIEERSTWSRKKLTGPALERFKARRLVELTITHHPNKAEVGGRVDEIELDASGIRWLHLKPNCARRYP